MDCDGRVDESRYSSMLRMLMGLMAFLLSAMGAAKTPNPVSAQDQAPSVAAAPDTPVTRLFKPWINGVSADEPQMQVQRYDDDTYVIRQSIRTNFEGPFLYVLFGSNRAL